MPRSTIKTKPSQFFSTENLDSSEIDIE